MAYIMINVKHDFQVFSLETVCKWYSWISVKWMNEDSLTKAYDQVSTAFFENSRLREINVFHWSWAKNILAKQQMF